MSARCFQSPVVLRAAAAAALVAAAALWMTAARAIPDDLATVKDESLHARAILRAIDNARHARDVLRADPSYPPAYYVLAYACGRFLGSADRWCLALPNLALYLLLVALTFGLVRRNSSRAAALTAAAIAAATHFDRAWQVTPVMALSCAAVLVPSLCGRLRAGPTTPGFALLAIGVAFALLAKQSALLFLPAPVLGLLVAWRRSGRAGEAHLAKTALALALGAGAAYAAFYRLVPGDWMLANVTRRSARVIGEAPLWSDDLPQNLKYYPALLLGRFWPLFVAMGVELARRKGRLTPAARSALFVAALPTAALMAFQTKYAEYLLPTVPLWGAAIAMTLFPAGERLGAFAAAYGVVAMAVVGAMTTTAADDWERRRGEFAEQSRFLDALRADVAPACADGVLRTASPLRREVPLAWNNHERRAGRRDCVMREWNVEREPRPSALLVVRPSLPEKPASCFTADEWADWQRSKIYLMSPLESEVATMRAVIDGFRPVLSRRWAAGRNRPGTSYSLCEPR